MSLPVLLRPRSDHALPERLAASAAVVGAGADIATADVDAWLAERAAAHRFTVERVPLDAMDLWSSAPDTGNIGHRSGRFFTVEGLSVTVDEGPFRHWQQPIIRQPEIGILGLLATEIDGVLHFLLQAKMEPGNRNLLQLSPTVQATRSNYTGVHRGGFVRHLEHFTRPELGAVIHVDVLQSEHGAWFHRKFNRNVLVETTAPVRAGGDFRWFTLGQIGELLRRDNVVNMDTRTIVACLPVAPGGDSALGTDAELTSWFTVERARRDIEVARIPLAEVAGWERGQHAIHRTDDRYFHVVAVRVEAGSREVASWSQPLFEPQGTGIVAFLTRLIGGEPHLLVQAKAEAGFLGGVELGPTVQSVPANWADVPAEARPPFLDAVLAAPPTRIRYAAVHSEEGGRFLHAESRYLFVDVDDEQAPLDPPAGFRWATPGQLTALTRHGQHVNVQARTLLACLNAGAVRLA